MDYEKERENEERRSLRTLDRAVMSTPAAASDSYQRFLTLAAAGLGREISSGMLLLLSDAKCSITASVLAHQSHRGEEMSSKLTQHH